MFSGSNNVIYGGTFNNQTKGTSRGMDLLMQWVATGAFHNSDELYDTPKCHPHTRIAVLDDIMKWVSASELARDDFMMWLFGPAGAGKSAIAKRIAEIAASQNLLIATFFFSSMSGARNTKDRLVATLAYQLALSIPDTRSHIENAIEQDPAIFKKNIPTQVDTLLIKPFRSASSTQVNPSQKLIIIDGLDECQDRQAQVAILDAISSTFPKYNLPIIFLVVSRPELDLVTSFNRNEPLKSIHRRLALDDTYKPNDDIRLFFSDKFAQIKDTHPSRSSIPTSWPSEQSLQMLVNKSSGQFIYAATVVRFVESNRHRPTTRLDVILGISPPGTTNPFAEMDALYSHIFSSVDDIQVTLRIIGLYIAPAPISILNLLQQSSVSPENFLSLERGDISLALVNLSSILSYEPSGHFKVLHASLIDFLFDRRRSTTFYIDLASTCTDFVRRIFHHVSGKGCDGKPRVHLFFGIVRLCPWILKGQLGSEILNFNFDAFMRIARGGTSVIHEAVNLVISTFSVWRAIIDYAGLDDKDNNEALDKFNKSFESRLQKYRVDWRLQLLLTLAVVNGYRRHHDQYLDGVRVYGAQGCRRADILLKMDEHDLHLIDRDALDLRHAYIAPILYPRLLDDVMSHCVDGDKYASAALHCMRFLSNPPKCSEMGFTYLEWEEACATAFHMLCILLPQANTSLELVQTMSNHDIHPAAPRDDLFCPILWVQSHILAFLSRANVCVNWRIISAIQLRTQVVTDNSMAMQKLLTMTWVESSFDQCCRHRRNEIQFMAGDLSTKDPHIYLSIHRSWNHFMMKF